MSAGTDPTRPAAAEALRRGARRFGEEKAAPGELGGGGLVPISGAPGTYVYDH
jgi:hypothetical protein